MSSIKEMLEVRKNLKKRKPTFLRQDYHKKKRLELKWRKPKGVHSKMRHHKRGHQKNVSPGYGSPALVKDMHKSGLRQVRICSVNDLAGIDKKTEGIIVSGSVGTKNRVEIVKESQKSGITILNLKDPVKFLSDVENRLKQKRAIKQENVKKKEENVKEREKAAKDNKGEGLAEKVEDEDKKKLEKEERDRVLTKKV